MFSEKVPKSSKNYICEKCKYNTVRESQFTRHLLTAKHQKLTSLTKKVPKSSKNYICECCEKQYNSRVGLWKHKQRCSGIPDESSNATDKKIHKQYHETDTIVELIKQNQEFKELILEQNKQLVELSQKPTTTNNTINNNHQKFNLNVFLNEQCKDAINMSDFLENMELDMEDLRETGRLGYVEGISRILVNKLRELDTYKRPLHCTDLKRETLYIKENDEWSKEDNSKETLKGLVNKVANKNCKNIEQWKDEHPEYNIFDTPENMDYMDLCNTVLGGLGEQECRQFRDKIARNVIKEVMVLKM
jgi:hypothetical protein|uniref:C2H2-type domain-containing protein n=1 Tax=viral metagenome TaxID=1070528 RepID=A0A6C0IKW9_9ZZZZ